MADWVNGRVRDGQGSQPLTRRRKPRKRFVLWRRSTVTARSIMRGAKIQAIMLILFLTTISASAQDNSPKKKPDNAAAQPCVIVTRHVHKFGENMSRVHAHRPFDYVEGNYPSGFKWRSELSDSDVRQLQQKGGKVVIMKPDYQASDLEDARKQCKPKKEGTP
jgi:hypothetical protein